MEKEQRNSAVKDLIQGIKVVMLTTLNQDGTFHSRPMWAQQKELEEDLWFFTRLDSSKTHEVQKDSHVTVNYLDEDDNCYVAVYGRGEVIQDRAKAEMLWNPTYEAWFPEGLNDPSMALLKVRVERAEVWDSPGSLSSKRVEFVKSLTVGKRSEGEREKRGKIDLTG
jgi:general stress protein 26